MTITTTTILDPLVTDMAMLVGGIVVVVVIVVVIWKLKSW